MSKLSKVRMRASVLTMSCAVLATGFGSLAANTASAASFTTTITSNGYVPVDQTMNVGDTIRFTNTDTTVHQVEIKPTTGFTCTVTPLVIQPTQTQSCTFTASGTYNYSDPNGRGNTYKGTLKVNSVTPAPAVGSVALTASRTTVTYPANVTLSGQVSPNAASASVDIYAQASGKTEYTKVTSAPVAANGNFTVDVSPQIQTSYRAQFQNGGATVMSSVVAVQVRPKVVLALRSATKRHANLQTRVSSLISYEGNRAIVQRMNSNGNWVFLRGVTLGADSSGRFGVTLRKGVNRFRTYLSASQAGAGYLPSASNSVTLRR